jgi:hypothetical protein
VLVDKKGGFWRLFKGKETVSPTGVSRSRIDARMEEESIKAKKESII